MSGGEYLAILFVYKSPDVSGSNEQEIDMASLIEKNSHTYLRRLAREIRSNFKHGVYYHAANGEVRRVNEVMASLGCIYIKSHTGAGWLGVEDVDAFTDGYGRHITASRRIGRIV